MRRAFSLLSLSAIVALSGSLLPAQITMLNFASGGPRFVTTTGTAHKIDRTVFRIGGGSVARATVAANASYLATGVALDPATSGCLKGDPGFTIQFWYRPGAGTTFQYLFGDRAWTGANGAFRCFQNGAAGAGNLILRGPLTQVATTGAPLTSALDPNGWLHCAVVGNSKTGMLSWYINGTLNNSGASTTTGQGTNLTCMGYNGSSSAGTTGNIDAYRIYSWARTAADIKADYTKLFAVGVGPSGCTNRPDLGNYRCERSVNSHIATNALAKEPIGPFTRLFTTGDTIEWGATSPATGPFAAVALMNLFAPGTNPTPRQDAYLAPTPLPGGPYVTAAIPGLVLGSFLSVPTLPELFWPVPIVYGNNVGAKTGLTVPPNLGLKDGARIDIQWIVIDPTYTPLGFGATNNLSFQYIDAKAGGEHFHAEARGVSSLQDTGFFEIWNTGSVPIKEVCIDLTGTAAVWNPTGNLNSGGNLSTGTSFRFLTDGVCDLTPATGTRYTLTGNKLCFKFACPPAPANGFEGPTNHFVFDCATTPNQAGNLYAGATVSVTFCNNKMLSGKLVVDPKAPTRASQLDL